MTPNVVFTNQSGIRPEAHEAAMLQKTTGGSNKQWSIFLYSTQSRNIDIRKFSLDLSWCVDVEYGKIGGKQTCHTKTRERKYEDAKRIFDKAIKEQLVEGYKIISAGKNPKVCDFVPDARDTRKCYTCGALAKDHTVNVDYAKVETNLLAQGGQSLLDVHKQTAAEALGVKPEEVTPEQRKAAKVANFPAIYGPTNEVKNPALKEFFDFMPSKTNNGAIEPEDLDVTSRGGKFAVEEKYDGSFYMARHLPDSRITFTSRRISAKDNKPVEKGANLPHIFMGPDELAYTLLLGEIVSPNKGFSDSAGIMNSGPEKAIKKQKEGGWLKYIVYDCLWFKGQDIRYKPFGERRTFAAAAVKEWSTFLTATQSRNKALGHLLDKDYVTLSPFIDQLPSKAYADIVKKGGEGIMLKRLDPPYGEGVFKCKKHVDVSAFICGFTEAKEGKYEGLIGAINFAVTISNQTAGGMFIPPETIDGVPYIEIGQCSGMTDEVRKEISKNRGKYMRRVIDVITQPPDDPDKFSVRNGDRLRHPRFSRFRDDLSWKQCTAEKLIQDFKGVVRK